MGFVDPLIAIIMCIGFLIVLLHRRANLGLALNATALLLAFLAVEWTQILPIIINTTLDPAVISVCAATFAIMLLTELYKETGMIRRLSESMSRLINNPKVVLCTLPAIIGLLPVGGGALMSAPVVDSEAEKLQMAPSKKAYVNLWFRHTIFPVYPLSPVIITTAFLTKVPLASIALRQIPVVAVMIIVGYIIGFWKVPSANRDNSEPVTSKKSDFKSFMVSFSPILMTILIVVTLNLAGLYQILGGFDVAVAIFVGLMTFAVITKLDFSLLAKPFRRWAIYGITAAAYGAFFLRNVMISAGISEVFSDLVRSGNIDIALFLTIAPATLGLMTGSPQGGVAVVVSILSTVLSLPFAVKVAALVYIGAYLGYTIAPTHLCLTFTANYFKCSLARMYRYVLPSFLMTFPAALIVYFLF